MYEQDLSRCDDSRLTFSVPESGERVPTDILFKSVLIPVIFIVSFFSLDICIIIGIANKLTAITIFLFQIFVVERHNSSRQQSTYFNCFKIYLRLVAYNMSKFKSTNCT